MVDSWRINVENLIGPNDQKKVKYTLSDKEKHQ